MSQEREEFEVILLDEGVELGQICPGCGSSICGFPDLSSRPYEGGKSEVRKWECWSCRKEFVQVYLPNKPHQLGPHPGMAPKTKAAVDKLSKK